MKKLEYLGRRNICGERVRKERVTRRLSQERLAAKMQMRGVEIEQDAISRVEAGERLVTDYELRAYARSLKSPSKVFWTRNPFDPTDRKVRGIFLIFPLDITP